MTDIKRGARLPQRDTKAGYWRRNATCREMDADLFYPAKDAEPELVWLAKSACQECPVIEECLAEAFTNGENFGIWGGLLPDERETLRRQLRIPRGKPPEIPFPHGTDAGHRRHGRAGTPPCDACCKAHLIAREKREAKVDKT